MAQQADWPLEPLIRVPGPHPFLVVVSAIVSLALWSAVFVQLVFVSPRLEKTFADFKMRVPLLTEWVIHDFRWGVPAVSVAMLLVCIALGRRSLWPWSLLLFALPLVINVLMGVGLYLPYMELLDGLAGGGKK